jgi:hypothetical protein
VPFIKIIAILIKAKKSHCLRLKSFLRKFIASLFLTLSLFHLAMKHVSYPPLPWRRLLCLAFLVGTWLTALPSYAQTVAGDLTAAWLGTIDEANLTVNDLPANGRVAQLLSASAASAGATLDVVNSNGQPVPRSLVLTSDLRLRVTALDGTQKSYALQPTGSPLPVEVFTDAPSSTQASLFNRVLRISGTSEFHITGTSNPLKGSLLDMQGDNVWLYFEGIRPSKFSRQLLAQVLVDGQRARIDTTIRLVQYLQGCVLISQPSTYQALEAFQETNLGGGSKKFNLYTYYKASELDVFHNTIASFRLRKGYMATFAENEDGTGASKVYIAPDNDLVITSLPANLQGKVSMVRVLPWAWVSKKGWCSAPLLGDSLHATWNYNWNNDGQSTLDMEYVPIRQTQWWPSFSITNAKQKVTHLLGFNEPNNSVESNMTVDQAIAAWPGMLQSGLRVGSPAPTDGGATWLYSFMDKADLAGYRVDFVAVHFYRGCQTPRQFYAFLKAIYDRTKRPIWVTEWNNGANWTTSASCPKPTYAEQAAKIQAFVTMLDTARIVERYSLYQWVEDTRKLYVNDSDPSSITQAGIAYRNQVSPMAYAASPVAEAGPLPVTLLDFSAQAQAGAVALAWHTASELHSARFEVERSLDGVTFGKLDEVAAAGTSASTQRYSLTDVALPTGARVLYYRLRQVDLDGAATYSPVRAVPLGKGELALYPNPAARQTTLRGAGAGQLVQVYDTMGRLVLTATTDAVGTAELALPAQVIAGVYIVRVAAQALRLSVR